MATSKKSMPGRGAKGKHQAKLKPQDCTLGLQVVNPKAAGIDIGNEEHWVAVPPAMDGNPVPNPKEVEVLSLAVAERVEKRLADRVAGAPFPERGICPRNAQVDRKDGNALLKRGDLLRR